MISWAQDEYALLIQGMKSSAGGVHLRGPIGGGMGQLVRRAIDDLKHDYPLLRIMCSPVLAELDYASLAPLLAPGQYSREANSSGLLREAMAAVRHRLGKNPEATRLLIVVEEADYLDAASAYVLGQLVCSGLVVLLVQSSSDQKDSMILDGLETVARLEIVALEPLELQDASVLIERDLRGPVTTGTLVWIHGQCAGLPDLLQDFCRLLSRQGALLYTGSHYTARGAGYAVDTQSERCALTLARRYEPQTQKLINYLCLCGSLSRAQAEELCPGAVSTSNAVDLIAFEGEKIFLASEYFARSLRSTLALELQSRMALEIAQVIPAEQFPLRLVLSLMNAGQMPEDLDLLTLVRTAAAAEHYEEIRELYALLDESARNEIEDFVWIAGLIVDRSAPGSGGDFVEMTRRRRAVEQAASDFHEQGNDLEGIHMLKTTHGALAALISGDVDEACAQADQVLGSELNTVIPLGQYRLLALAVKARAWIIAGKSCEVPNLLEEFSAGGPIGDFLAHGSLSVLHAYAQCHLGRISVARALLRDALPELLAYDPAGLLPLALMIHGIVARSNLELAGGLEPDAARADSLLDRVTVAGERKLFFAVDNYQLSVIRHGQVAQQKVPAVPAWDPGIFAISAEYYAWRATDIRDGVHSGHSPVPDDCVLPSSQQKLIGLLFPAEVHDLESKAQSLFDSGHALLAFDLMVKLISELDAVQHLRMRGAAIRKVHGWLHSLGEKPWGPVKDVLEKSGLTMREEEIANYIRQGLSNREIARTLTVSQRTIEGHVYRIFAKLGVSNRNELKIGYPST
ncbi:response regulator transcription factor [Glutamicibacter mysorens]